MTNEARPIPEGLVAELALRAASFLDTMEPLTGAARPMLAEAYARELARFVMEREAAAVAATPEKEDRE